MRNNLNEYTDRTKLVSLILGNGCGNSGERP